jgi:hypothetical protein
MINVFYNSKDFLDWVAGLPIDENKITNFITKIMAQQRMALAH